MILIIFNGFDFELVDRHSQHVPPAQNSPRAIEKERPDLDWTTIGRRQARALILMATQSSPDSNRRI